MNAVVRRLGSATIVALLVIGANFSPVKAGKIYWIDPTLDVIQRANLDGTEAEQLVAGATRGLVLDLGNGKMYWVNSVSNVIQRANLDGSDVEALVLLDMNARDLALDLENGKMYWVGDGIRRANLDGSNIETVVTIDSGFGIGSVDLDLTNGKVYWAQAELVPGYFLIFSIKRANLDGSNIQTVGGGPSSIPEIALDVLGGKVYWTYVDSHPDSDAYGLVQRANLIGGIGETLFVSIGFLPGFALDIGGGKMYWTNSELGRFQRANLDGTNVELLFEVDGAPSKIALDPPCGDGVPDSGEECDDGNNEDGDGCAADCTMEEPVPASSLLPLLVLLAILMTVSWAILRPKWGSRFPGPPRRLLRR